MLEERYFSSGNEPRFKIIMAGDSHVGKTTLFWKYIEGEYLQKISNVTTIDFKIKEVTIQGKTIKLYIWDTAGQEKYRAMVSSYFNGCQGIMLVFDLAKSSTFTSATTKWFQMAKSKCPDAHILLVGNKCDLSMEVDERQVEEWVRKNNVKYIKTSVKSDINVNQCYRILSEAIYHEPVIEKAKSFTLRNKDVKQKKQKSCC